MKAIERGRAITIEKEGVFTPKSVSFKADRI
jgi:hypothetical protein